MFCFDFMLAKLKSSLILASKRYRLLPTKTTRTIFGSAKKVIPFCWYLIRLQNAYCHVPKLRLHFFMPNVAEFYTIVSYERRKRNSESSLPFRSYHIGTANPTKKEILSRAGMKTKIYRRALLYHYACQRP